MENVEFGMLQKQDKEGQRSIPQREISRDTLPRDL